jgi:hypothetical protein
MLIRTRGVIQIQPHLNAHEVAHLLRLAHPELGELSVVETEEELAAAVERHGEEPAARRWLAEEEPAAAFPLEVLASGGGLTAGELPEGVVQELSDRWRGPGASCGDDPAFEEFTCNHYLSGFVEVIEADDHEVRHYRVVVEDNVATRVTPRLTWPNEVRDGLDELRGAVEALARLIS